MPERSRFVRGLRAWIGFKAVGVEYERQARLAGDTKYPFKKLLNLAFSGIFGFSTFPLRFATYSGLFVAFVSFVLGISIFIGRIFFHSTFSLAGWSSLMVSLFFMGGIQLFIIGILGEYVGMIYRETQARPLYIVRECIGFDTDFQNVRPAEGNKWTQFSTRR
jgi:dolichol-phosphate mannosyltransferase